MDETNNKKSNFGCLFFGALIILCGFGLLVSIFHSDKPIPQTNGWIKTYLTLDNKNETDTLITVVSPYVISKDYTLKKTVQQSFPFSDSLMTYTVDIPNGLINTISVIRFQNGTKLNLDGAIEGSIDRLKTNSQIQDLTYLTKDTVIQNINRVGR